MTREQQNRLNAMCGDLEAQIRLSSDGRYLHKSQVAANGTKLDKDSWRWIFVGTYKGWKAVPAIEGAGFIMLGASSKTLSIEDASAVIDMLFAFGNERGVQWSNPQESALKKLSDGVES